jgi:hypothetical protein
MKPSADLQRMLDTLGTVYSRRFLAELEAEAEAQARARGGRQVTRADWDDALDRMNRDREDGEQSAGDDDA